MNRRRFNHASLQGFAALIAAGVLCGPAISALAEGLPSTTPKALEQRIAAGDAPLVLDVRSREEFAAGHIPGAVNIPVTELARRVGELAPFREKEIVVHCEAGPRANAASKFLGRNGFRKLVELEGHMRAWREAGLPMKR